MKTDNTFVVQLTVGQLTEILKNKFPILSQTIPNSEVMKEIPKGKPEKDGPTFSGRILYGIAGIEDFFGVSHKTAWGWKEGWMKPAVKQRGRKIMVDADYAMILFEKTSHAERKDVKSLKRKLYH